MAGFHWEEGIEHARYVDEDRQNIEVLHIVDNPENDNGREAKLHILPADENDDQFKALLEHFSYDDIMEMTYVYNKNAEMAFKQEVIQIAKKAGLLTMSDIEIVSDEFITKLVESIFNDGVSDKELKEIIFKTKLQLFELDRVKASKNRKLKAQLRKAKTLKEVLYTMILIDEDIESSS